MLNQLLKQRKEIEDRLFEMEIVEKQLVRKLEEVNKMIKERSNKCAEYSVI